MRLYINVINNEIFENIEDLLFSNDKEIAEWFSKTFVGELAEEISPQYEIQVKSLSAIKKVFWKDAIKKMLDGIYWGTEQCEWLVPTLRETKDAIEQFKKFNKEHISHKKLNFVFLTSYWGSPIVKSRLEENFAYLDSNAYAINPNSKKVEVVVNDVGTLILLKKYPNLIPVFWRLFGKTLKMPLVEANGWEDAVKIPGEIMKNKTPEEIKQIREEITHNQKKMLSRTALHTPQFWSFAEWQGVKRASLDYNERYPDMFTDHTHTIDVYYPYGIIFVWRLCDTCWVKDIERSYYPLDRPCARECKKFDLFIKNFDPNTYKTFQRGNAQYMSNVDLSAIKGLIASDLEHRLIYTPLI